VGGVVMLVVFVGALIVLGGRGSLPGWLWRWVWAAIHFPLHYFLLVPLVYFGLWMQLRSGFELELQQ
jgi:hypothetical protein